MTIGKTRQTILEHLDPLAGEQIKTLLLTWLINSSGDLEEFEEFLTNQTTQITKKSLEYGEIDSSLSFQALTEEEMVQQSQLALESYRRKGVGVAHNYVREWIDRLGTERAIN
ncbi:MAG: hypothetical protein AB4290_10015 [Spirulina sp.]